MRAIKFLRVEGVFGGRREVALAAYCKKRNLSDVIAGIHSGHIEALDANRNRILPEQAVEYLQSVNSPTVVMISHCRQDLRRALDLSLLVSQAFGLQPELIKRSIDYLPGGTATQTSGRAERDISSAQAFVAIMSKQAHASPDVGFEVGVRWAKGEQAILLYDHNEDLAVMPRFSIWYRPMCRTSSREDMYAFLEEVSRTIQRPVNVSAELEDQIQKFAKRIPRDNQ